MPEGPELTDLPRLLRNPAFRAMAAEAVQRYVEWEEVARRPPLPGLTHEQTWEALALIRQLDEITHPIKSWEGLGVWYNITREGQHCLEHIRHHCRPDSTLHVLLHEREGHRYLVRSRIEEAIASCQLDGVIFDRGIVGRMLQENRSPRSAAGRLVKNAYEMLKELDTLSGEQFSPDLVQALYDRLTHGVEIGELQRGSRKTNLASTRSPDGLFDPDAAAEQLQMICDYANLDTGDPWEPRACRAYMILSSMAYWHLLPDFSDTVGRHMMRLFAVKNGYPGLAYLPTSVMIKRWLDGEVGSDVVRFGPDLRGRQRVAGEVDGTSDVLVYLQLTTEAIRSLRTYIDRTQCEEEALRQALDASELLNYRQRAVLSHALIHPDAEFRIRQHQQSYRVVYDTARMDLHSLVERGFLRMEQRGKAFVFTPSPDLQQRLAGKPDHE